jgi:hypothetical protein
MKFQRNRGALVRSLLGLALTALTFFALTAEAQELCLSHPQTEATSLEKATTTLKNGVDAAQQLMLLEQNLYFSSIHRPDALKDLRKNRNQLAETKSYLEQKGTQIPSEVGSALIFAYLSGLSGAAGVELYLTGQTTAFEAPSTLRLSTQDFLRFFPSTAQLPPGLVAQIDGSRTLVFLNAETQFQAELQLLARGPKASSLENYFLTSKCILSRLLVEKLKGLTHMTGELPDLGAFANDRACAFIKVADLEGPKSLINHGQRTKTIEGTYPKTFDLLNDSEKDFLRQVTQSRGLNAMGLVLNSALVQSDDEELTDLVKIDQILSAIEQKLLVSNASLSLLNEAAQSLTPLFAKEFTSQCHVWLAEGMAEGLNLQHQKLLRRLILFFAAEDLKNSPAILFSNAVGAISAAEALKAQLITYVETAFLTTLVHKGVLSQEHALAVGLGLRKSLESNIAESAIFQQAAASLHGRLNTKKTDRPEVLKLYPAFMEHAQFMQKMMDPQTSKRDLKFESSAIGKLFEGMIGNYPQPMRFIAEQILTRKSWQEQKTTWERLRAQLELDQKAHGYKCEKPSFATTAATFGRQMGGMSPDANLARQQACYSLQLLTRHLGLDWTKAPETLADVWWDSFVPNYKKGDLKIFETRYREFLKAEFANVYRVLDVPLNKLGFKSDLYVYDELTKPVLNVPAEDLMQRALRYVRSNIEQELLLVAKSQKLADLNSNIDSTLSLNVLLGQQEFSQFLPSIFSSEEEGVPRSRLFATVLQTHQKYQSELIRKSELDKRLNQDLIHTLSLPIIYLGGLAIVRAAALRTPGARAVGYALQSTAESARLVTQGYFSFLTVVFAGAFGHSYQWNKAISKESARLEEMKLSDYVIFEGDQALVQYNEYVTKRHTLSLEASDAKLDMWIYGGFTAFSAVMSVAEPLLMARAAKVQTSAAASVASNNLKKTGAIRRYWLRRGLHVDKVRLNRPMAWLGKPKDFELETLQAARLSSSHKMAEEGYRRIIYRLGQRISPHMGHAEKEALMAKELFGNSHNVSGLRAIAHEYERLFPDIIRGAL